MKGTACLSRDIVLHVQEGQVLEMARLHRFRLLSRTYGNLGEFDLMSLLKLLQLCFG
jgi:hypothetical protein